MTYNETGSGGVIVGGPDVYYGVIIGGCAVVTITRLFVTAFAEGDIVYNIHAARKGVLEKIVIKQVIVVNPQGVFVSLYKDTLNALWNEKDLVNYTYAKAYAENYYINLLAELEKLQRC